MEHNYTCKHCQKQFTSTYKRKGENTFCSISCGNLSSPRRARTNKCKICETPTTIRKNICEKETCIEEFNKILLDRKEKKKLADQKRNKERNCKKVSNYRKKLKMKFVEYLGGKCKICGYNKCLGSLVFHHANPDEKGFGIAGKGLTRSFESVKDELDKCILLCANCHGEVHGGLHPEILEVIFKH